MKTFAFWIGFFPFIFLLLGSKAFAVTPTPSPTVSSINEQTQNALNEQVTDLKERIASRVAQLKLVEKRGILGTVADVSDTQITLSDTSGNTRFVDVDELTKFSSPSAKAKDSFGISDITKGMKLGVLGLYNKQSRRILARFVNVVTFPKVIRGAIVGIDADTFSINLATPDGKRITVDIETITKTQVYTKEAGLGRSGFSKLKEDERVMVVGFEDIKDKSRLIASRVIHFPSIPKNPKINLQSFEATEEVIPSTGSGKKLTPITQ